MATSPLVLQSDEMEVVLLPEHGARLHRIRAFGVDLLRTPEDMAAHATDPFFWGAYPMAPWCNRIPPGLMEVAGRTVDLAPNFPDGTAIHGQVYGRPWNVDGDGSLSVTGGGDGWPWTYEARLRPTLAGPMLRLTWELTNRSDEPMPAGLGLHPWFVRPLEVSLAANAAYRSNGGSSARPEPVDGTPFDLRSGGSPPPDLDATWTALRQPSVRLRWPNAGIEGQLRFRTASTACVAVATPADPDATAVEPQTHGPDGLRRLANGEPDALALLAPGEVLGLVLELHVQRSG
jgi:aldose 1-epimerase